MLWILVALMTAAAVLAVVWPLTRRAKYARSGSDVEVYRDQLDEIERDQICGFVAAKEAEAARLEVSRRLIAAANAAANVAEPNDNAAPRRHRLVGAVALVAIPVGALSLYLAVGSPNLPGQPFAARVAAAISGDQSIEQSFTRLEAHLEQNPDDGRAWEMIAPIYMRVGRFDDAVEARRNALRLLEVTAEREADLGEALVAAANGIVTAQAKEAFDRAFRLDEANVGARFYVGLAAEQDGRKEEAARIWRKLLADAPDRAVWRAFVQESLARVDSSAAAAVRTPGANDSTGVGVVSVPDQQDERLRGMVERLVARLRHDGSDVDGWIQLVRSYLVLGESDKARAAVVDARRALANEPNKLRRLDDGAKRLGIGG